MKEKISEELIEVEWEKRETREWSLIEDMLSDADHDLVWAWGIFTTECVCAHVCYW